MATSVEVDDSAIQLLRKYHSLISDRIVSLLHSISIFSLTLLLL